MTDAVTCNGSSVLGSIMHKGYMLPEGTMPLPLGTLIELDALIVDFPQNQSPTLLCMPFQSEEMDIPGNYVSVWALMGDFLINGQKLAANQMLQLVSSLKIKNVSSDMHGVLILFSDPVTMAEAKSVDNRTNKELILIKDLVSVERCQEILESLDKDSLVLAGLYAPDKPVHDSEVRNTFFLNSTKPKLVTKTVQELVADHIEDFYGEAIEFWENPSLLYYPEGGFFKAHNDAEHVDLETGKSYKINHRDYSVVVFLNDDYEGGELTFPDLGITVSPKAGRVVCFPSDSRFLHEAVPVKRGKRFQLVTWLTAFGSDRTHDPRRHGPVAKRQYRDWTT